MTKWMRLLVSYVSYSLEKTKSWISLPASMRRELQSSGRQQYQKNTREENIVLGDCLDIRSNHHHHQETKGVNTANNAYMTKMRRETKRTSQLTTTLVEKKRSSTSMTKPQMERQTLTSITTLIGVKEARLKSV